MIKIINKIIIKIQLRKINKELNKHRSSFKILETQENIIKIKKERLDIEEQDKIIKTERLSGENKEYLDKLDKIEWIIKMKKSEIINEIINLETEKYKLNLKLYKLKKQKTRKIRKPVVVDEIIEDDKNSS